MKISLTSVIVEDQDKALAFYTEILGFEKCTDIPMGEFKWLTVTSPDGPEGIELALEPNANEAVKVFQQALVDQGIPWTAFEVDDIQAEFERLSGLGVTFTVDPTPAGPATIAVFSDTCGNLIQIYQA
jgi:glyoxylase I family protein